MIKGAKCYLRAVEPTDVDTIYKWENDNIVWTDSYTYHPTSRIAVENLLVQNTIDVYQTRQTRLMVCSIANNEIVGCVDMFDFDPYNMRCGIGILIDNNYRKQGYATEAVRLMCQYLFETLTMHTIYASMRKSNIASQRVFEHCLFKQTGLHEGWIKVGDKYEDEVFMQLTKT